MLSRRHAFGDRQQTTAPPCARECQPTPRALRGAQLGDGSARNIPTAQQVNITPKPQHESEPLRGKFAGL